MTRQRCESSQITPYSNHDIQMITLPSVGDDKINKPVTNYMGPSKTESVHQVDTPQDKNPLNTISPRKMV